MTTPADGRSGRRKQQIAIALWILLAVVVFNVTFDWQTRAAGHAFIRSQVERHEHGQPTVSINDGFRPMVRAAAVRSAVWLVLIAATGTALVMASSRGHQAS
jgi:hypothetical protein